MRYVVDTNIWIEFLRKNPKVRTRLREKLAQRTPINEICIIPVVYYELLRGLEKRRDQGSINFIKTYWTTLSYYEATKQIWDEAIRLWVMTIRQNTMPGDRDLLIAAFAIQLSATVVSRNVRHFSVFGLSIENWLDD
jgi:predicted nucleic acid-binding protein